jgi:hypothetical protein
MRKEIKIGFKNIRYFGKPTNAHNFFLKMHYIKNKFQFIEHDKPDFIFSNRVIPKGPFIRIYYNPENIRPPAKKMDWSFGPDYEDYIKHPRYKRQPNIVKLGVGQNLVDVKKNINPKELLKTKTKFCAFVYARSTPTRVKFFRLLSKYKKIDSPGRLLNNMPFIGNYKRAHLSRRSRTFGDEKIEFLKSYKFVIAFENSSYPGYISEKLTDPMLVNSIPVYWGNPLIYRDFNPASFIHPYGRKKSIGKKYQIEYLVEKIIELDKDEDKYIQFLSRPWYNDNKLPDFLNPEKILEQYIKIFNSKC